MIRVITQRRLAGIANVGEMVVSKMVKGRLAKCIVMQGGRKKGIDVDCALVVEWLATHGVFVVDDKYCRIILNKKEQKAAVKTKPKNKKNKPVDVVEKVIQDAPEQETSQVKKDFNKQKQTMLGTHRVEDLQELTVRQIVDRFGSVDGFKRFVEAKRIILDNELKETKLMKTRGQLIDINLVSNTVIELLNLSFSRLVTDVPTRIAQQVIATVQAGGPDVAASVERIYRDSTQTILKNIKASILKSKLLKM